MGLSSCCAVVSHDKSNGTLPPPDSAELPLPAPLPVAAAAALSFFDFLSKLSARDARGEAAALDFLSRLDARDARGNAAAPDPRAEFCRSRLGRRLVPGDGGMPRP